jgi:hypothetical protein
MQLINECPSGTAVFAQDSSNRKYGSMTCEGPLEAAVAWVDGFEGANCEQSGKNCGIVEFTLVNPTSVPGNTHNAVNYSLLKGVNGNHQLWGQIAGLIESADV